MREHAETQQYVDKNVVRVAPILPRAIVCWMKHDTNEHKNRIHRNLINQRFGRHEGGSK
jgi:hypothetical protein